MDFKEIESKIKMIPTEHATYWSNALAGEVGEVCNLVKKFERNGSDFSNTPYDGFFIDLDKELADSFIYLVLVARYFQSDLERAILNKIEEVNKRDYMKDVD